jgi:hypothetical protein
MPNPTTTTGVGSFVHPSSCALPRPRVVFEVRGSSTVAANLLISDAEANSSWCGYEGEATRIDRLITIRKMWKEKMRKYFLHTLFSYVFIFLFLFFSAILFRRVVFSF